MINPSKTSRIAAVGATASLLCAIHCMAFPLLVTILPAIGMGFALTGWFHKSLLYSSLIISTIGMCWGYRTHRQKHKFVIFITLIGAAYLYSYLAHQTHYPMRFLILGGVCLIWANLWNRSLCRNCSHCNRKS